MQVNPPPTAILGGPGHGKTTVSLKASQDERVAQRYGIRRFFVRCDSSTTRDALVSDVAFSMGLQPEPNLEPQMFAVLKQGPAVLVFDNAETPWEADPQATEALLAELAAISGLCLVISIRGTQRPQGVAWREPIVVPPLELHAAREAFLAVSGKGHRNDRYLDSLIDAVDRVPLGICLLACQAEGQPNLDGLYSRWGAEKTALLQRSGGGTRLTNLEVSLEISITSSRMSEPARRLLMMLGLLPDGTAWEDLESLLPGLSAKASADLRHVGLAYDENSRLRVHSLVREYTGKRYTQSETDLDATIAHFVRMPGTERVRGTHPGAI